MFTLLRKLTSWFAHQPVAIRAALVTAVAAFVSLVVVEWFRERRDERSNVEQRQLVARKDLAAEIVPQFRGLTDLVLTIGASVRIRDDTDGPLVDSLLQMVDHLLMSQQGTGASVAHAFADSVGIDYARTIFAADSLVHELVLLHAADRKRTKPEALNALRNSVLARVKRAGTLSVRVQNALLAEQ